MHTDTDQSVFVDIAGNITEVSLRTSSKFVQISLKNIRTKFRRCVFFCLDNFCYSRMVHYDEGLSGEGQKFDNFQVCGQAI